MNRRQFSSLLLSLPVLPYAAPIAAQEKVPALGEELTPFGAVRGASRTRAIPPWKGGLTRVPNGWKPGSHLPDPYDEDGRWFTVGPADIDRYKVRLSAGLQAMLTKYPSFEIPVFPSNRSAAAPQRVYDETIGNAKRAKLGENGLALSGARVGVPFPIPANGVQAMWNHILRWRGNSFSRTGATVLPEAGGIYTAAVYREDWQSSYAAGIDGGRPFHYRRTTLMPKAEAGTTLLLHGTLNPIQSGFAAWFRQGETGKPVRASDFAYDTPDPASGGIRTADMLDMFGGPLDRFDFALVTRREMYVPYNASRMNTPGLAPVDFLWLGHPNPQFLRYEMHRVWIVEARLKSGFRHALPERTYYLDEDSWQIVMADHYDAKGDLVRYAEAHGIAYPQVPVFAPALEITYDLAGDRYVVNGLDNQLAPPDFAKPLRSEDFAPETLERKRRPW
ncbi:DUF1329 domain-containing protein [Azospirillum sp. YIM DDC1]|uniref:DUF1329 domain-containing protein n=1 Tax=Azospirillum aestuarii TaxID=2802052 RepID=A0ABS1HUT7_9PROT|nr:DUF1329 domain-containing protein [Azospirillum aestuarii]MBK4718569.1 DUF1329 domain-containing protein [Azospirillum aestuarii]